LERGPILAGIGERECTHVNQGFVTEDIIADIQQQLWSHYYKTRAQNKHPRIFQGKAACVQLLLTAHFSQNKQTALFAISVLLAEAARDMWARQAG
jgi:hypothetical protein